MAGSTRRAMRYVHSASDWLGSERYERLRLGLLSAQEVGHLQGAPGAAQTRKLLELKAGHSAAAAANEMASVEIHWAQVRLPDPVRASALPGGGGGRCGSERCCRQLLRRQVLLRRELLQPSERSWVPLFARSGQVGWRFPRGRHGICEWNEENRSQRRLKITNVACSVPPHNINHALRAVQPQKQARGAAPP